MATGNGPIRRSASRAGDGGSRAIRPRMAPSLKRLITDPRRLGTIRLWQALGASEREAAAIAYLSAEDGGRTRLDQVVAEARNFRSATVGKWPENRIAAAMRFAPVRDPPHRLAAAPVPPHPWPVADGDGFPGCARRFPR